MGSSHVSRETERPGRFTDPSARASAQARCLVGYCDGSNVVAGKIGMAFDTTLLLDQR